MLRIEWTQGKGTHYGYQYASKVFHVVYNHKRSLVVFPAMICVFAADWVFRMQSKWSPVSRDAYNVVIYSFFALFKIVFIVFNVVPYVALLIIG